MWECQDKTATKPRALRSLPAVDAVANKAVGRARTLRPRRENEPDRQ